MVCQPVRFALLLGAISAVTVSTARADHCAPAPTAPCTRTICVTECVPETYKVKRTVYRTECRQETVDGFRCEMVPEVRERTVTCVKKVPVWKEETRKVCKNVVCYEDRTVMKTCWKTVQETCMKKKLVRHGHWTCETVCKKDHMACLRNHFKKCCDPCDPCCKEPEHRTTTRKKWVHCPEYVECPVTVCKKVCYQVPVTCKVAVCKQVWTEETCKVCTWNCVTENRVEKYTVCVARQVACKVTRTVRVCVPHEEEVTCTRMVARTVTREVPAGDCCATSCCDPCGKPKHSFFSRFKRNNDCGCCR